eukprot:1764380-Pleurochrysis_carterae.AAC.1
MSSCDETVAGQGLKRRVALPLQSPLGARENAREECAGRIRGKNSREESAGRKRRKNAREE